MNIPSLGRIVLYKTVPHQSRGQSIGCPAIITTVDDADTGYVGLTVFTQHGSFYAEAWRAEDPTVGHADDLAEGEWCWPSKEPARAKPKEKPRAEETVQKATEENTGG